MKTKIVYVLTCAEDKQYIEQGLMSIYSARYHNPTAHIVLVMDDLTSNLVLKDSNRNEILKYISEKMVVHFDKDKAMHYRSRWLKTNLRNLIDGDYLFIDCDTIVQQSLSEVDDIDMEMGAVLDEHLSIKEYPAFLLEYIKSYADIIDYKYTCETEYYNSGVMFIKDTQLTHLFYTMWHQEWLNGVPQGVNIDQPSLGKTNMSMNHTIKRMDDTWNTLVFMRPSFIMNAKILHFWGLKNVSLMYSKSFLTYVQYHGIDALVKSFIINPTKSLIPFPCLFSKMNLIDYVKERKVIKDQLRVYKEYIDSDLFDFPWNGWFRTMEMNWIRNGMFGLASTSLIVRNYIKIKLFRQKDIRIVSFP